MPDNYDIVEHRHRFAAWTAGSAAGTSKLCRFEVLVARCAIEKSGLQKEGACIEKLTAACINEDFDAWHQKMRG